MMRLPLLLLIILLNGFSLRAEQIVFEMSVWGYKFGTMVVSRTFENDSTEVYTVEAKGETDFLWMKRKEESLHKVVYVNGKLQSSEYTYLNRGEKEKWSNVYLQDGQYIVESSNGDKRIGEESIDYSMVRLYFQPTFERGAVFCEEDCSFSSITAIPEENKLKISCQDGNSSTYHITDGEVTELEIHLSVATVKLKRVS